MTYSKGEKNMECRGGVFFAVESRRPHRGKRAKQPR